MLMVMVVSAEADPAHDQVPIRPLLLRQEELQQEQLVRNTPGLVSGGRVVGRRVSLGIDCRIGRLPGRLAGSRTRRRRGLPDYDDGSCYSVYGKGSRGWDGA